MGNICFCGKEKREERLTCPRCFETYRKETKGRKGLLQWVKEQALKKLEDLGATEQRPQTNLELDLIVKKGEVRDLENEVKEKTFLNLREQLAGAGQVTKEEHDALREDIRADLWKEKGGNKLYAQMKEIEREIEQRVLPLRNLLQEIGKAEKEQSSVSRLIDSVFPENK